MFVGNCSWAMLLACTFMPFALQCQDCVNDEVLIIFYFFSSDFALVLGVVVCMFYVLMAGIVYQPSQW